MFRGLVSGINQGLNTASGIQQLQQQKQQMQQRSQEMLMQNQQAVLQQMQVKKAMEEEKRLNTPLRISELRKQYEETNPGVFEHLYNKAKSSDFVGEVGGEEYITVGNREKLLKSVEDDVQERIAFGKVGLMDLDSQYGKKQKQFESAKDPQEKINLGKELEAINTSRTNTMNLMISSDIEHKKKLAQIEAEAKVKPYWKPVMNPKTGQTEYVDLNNMPQEQPAIVPPKQFAPKGASSGKPTDMQYAYRLYQKQGGKLTIDKWINEVWKKSSKGKSTWSDVFKTPNGSTPKGKTRPPLSSFQKR